MSVSIISCPGCKQLILSDTVQCPSCQHVLDQDKAGMITTELPAVVKAGEDEVPCPDCGEQVRAGLVRCWRCGGFLREEIAETYQKRQVEGSPHRTLLRNPIVPNQKPPKTTTSNWRMASR